MGVLLALLSPDSWNLLMGLNMLIALAVLDNKSCTSLSSRVQVYSFSFHCSRLDFPLVFSPWSSSLLHGSLLYYRHRNCTQCVMCTCLICILMLRSKSSVSPISQLLKVEHRKTKQLLQSHITSIWQNQKAKVIWCQRQVLPLCSIQNIELSHAQSSVYFLLSSLIITANNNPKFSIFQPLGSVEKLSSQSISTEFSKLSIWRTHFFGKF